MAVGNWRSSLSVGPDQSLCDRSHDSSVPCHGFAVHRFQSPTTSSSASTTSAVSAHILPQSPKRRPHTTPLNGHEEYKKDSGTSSSPLGFTRSADASFSSAGRARRIPAPPRKIQRMPITIPILFLHPRLPILRNLFLSPAAPPTTIYKATMPRSLRRDRPLRLQQDKWLRIVDLPVITPLQHPLSSSFPQIPPTLIDQTSAKIASLLTRGLRHLLETRLSIVFVLVRKTQFPWLESRQGSSGAVDLWSRKRWKSSACLLSVVSPIIFSYRAPRG